MSTKTMTKTEARKHLADAKRSLAAAQEVLKPTPAWILREMGRSAPSEEEVQRRFFAKVHEAEESLAALRAFRDFRAYR